MIFAFSFAEKDRNGFLFFKCKPIVFTGRCFSTGFPLAKIILNNLHVQIFSPFRLCRGAVFFDTSLPFRLLYLTKEINFLPGLIVRERG